jgi:hypothetical protein
MGVTSNIFVADIRYPISDMNIALSDIGQKIGVVLNDKIKS